MDNIQKLLILVFLLSSGAGQGSLLHSQEKNASMISSVDYSDQTSWVLGYFVRGQITGFPHSEWFHREYEAYNPSEAAVNKLKALSRDGLTIKIVLGTWCPDSRKQVPRFLKITDSISFPESLITFIGVDDVKASPVGEYEDLDIQRVPTFIFYKNNIEAGRIIENPLTSLEQDMVNILNGKE